MSWLKRLFRIKDKEESAGVETPNQSAPFEPTFAPEKKAEFIGICSLCNEDITSKDKTKELEGNIVHKRCFKRVKKQAFSGLSPEAIINSFKKQEEE